MKSELCIPAVRSFKFAHLKMIILKKDLVKFFLDGS